MSVLETEFKKFAKEMRSEMAELKRIIVTHMAKDKWVQQDIACAMLRMQPRQLRRVRVHLDVAGNKTGCIGWKKGQGKNILYYLPDIEKYNGEFVINSK